MSRARAEAALWSPDTVDPERALELADPACWTCWSYRCMTAGRTQRCPWCSGTGLPKARESRYTDVTPANVAQVRASRSRRARGKCRKASKVDRDARARFTGTMREHQKKSRAYDAPPK